MAKRRKIAEGKTKIIYSGPTANTLIVHYKDDTTAFNKAKSEKFRGKGVLNNRISERIFSMLNQLGFETHFVRRINMREQLIKKADMVPLEVCVRNLCAGSVVKRLGVPEGHRFRAPCVDFHLKNDDLGDPLVSEELALEFDWTTSMEYSEMKDMALEVNRILQGFFAANNLLLYDFKLEFGRVWDPVAESRLVICDEISPDSCRLRDMQSGQILDKDLFRTGQGGLLDAYNEVARRICDPVMATSLADPNFNELDNVTDINTISEFGLDAANSSDGRDIRLEAGDGQHVRVMVTLHKELLDPQGKAILLLLKNEGFNEVSEVRQGKVYDLVIKGGGDQRALQNRVESFCRSLLANETIEHYEIVW